MSCENQADEVSVDAEKVTSSGRTTANATRLTLPGRAGAYLDKASQFRLLEYYIFMLQYDATYFATGKKSITNANIAQFLIFLT
jgi:hypothetical protein